MMLKYHATSYHRFKWSCRTFFLADRHEKEGFSASPCIRLDLLLFAGGFAIYRRHPIDVLGFQRNSSLCVRCGLAFCSLFAILGRHSRGSLRSPFASGSPSSPVPRISGKILSMEVGIRYPLFSSLDAAKTPVSSFSFASKKTSSLRLSKTWGAGLVESASSMNDSSSSSSSEFRSNFLQQFQTKRREQQPSPHLHLYPFNEHAMQPMARAKLPTKKPTSIRVRISKWGMYADSTSMVRLV